MTIQLSSAEVRFLLEHFAVAVSAVSGVLAGRGKHLDLFGVIVLALATALGGGTIRDLCLGAGPVFWVRDSNYVLTAAGSAVLTFFMARFWVPPVKFLLVADAFGLALFSIIGAEKALAHQAPDSIAILLGVVTGVAGGILRDTLSGEIPLVFRPAIYLYATASFCGLVAFIFLQHTRPGDPWNRLVAMDVILILRLLAIQFRLRLPVFKPSRPT